MAIASRGRRTGLTVCLGPFLLAACLAPLATQRPSQPHLPNAIERYEAECETGELASCRALQAAWLRAEPRPPNLAAVRLVQKRLCQGSHADACRKGPEVEWPADAGAWHLSCALGNAASCFEVSRRLRGELGSTPLTNTIDEWACQHGSPWSCSALAEELADGGLSPGSPARALELYRRACDLGSGWHCFGLADAVEENDPDAGAALRAQSISVYAADCEADDTDNCAFAAAHFQLGQYVPRDLARVVRLRERTCEGGDHFDCMRVGWAYRYGRHAPKDLARALRLLEKGCKGDIPAFRTCDELAYLYQSGVEVSLDESKSLRFRELARTAWTRSQVRSRDIVDAGKSGPLHLSGGGLCEDLASDAASAFCPQRETSMDRYLLFGMEDVMICAAESRARTSLVSRFRVEPSRDGGVSWSVLEGRPDAAPLDRCVRGALASWPAESWPPGSSMHGKARVYEFLLAPR